MHAVPEGVEAAEVLIQHRGELAVGLVTTIGGHVGPEHRVVDLPTEIEGQVLLQQVHRGQGLVLARLGQLFGQVRCSGG